MFTVSPHLLTFSPLQDSRDRAGRNEQRPRRRSPSPAFLGVGEITDSPTCYSLAADEQRKWTGLSTQYASVYRHGTYTRAQPIIGEENLPNGSNEILDGYRNIAQWVRTRSLVLCLFVAFLAKRSKLSSDRPFLIRRMSPLRNCRMQVRFCSIRLLRLLSTHPHIGTACYLYVDARRDIYISYGVWLSPRRLVHLATLAFTTRRSPHEVSTVEMGIARQPPM
jgi:hypothetical protein